VSDGTHAAYIIGDTDGLIRPDDSITRAEAATVFFRLLSDEVRDNALTAENTFTDVSDDAWYCQAVSTLASLGILTGRTSTTFDPDAPLTRAELAVLCVQFDETTADGSGSSFSDIAGHWAQAEIEQAAALGWVLGYPDGTFRPDEPVTRAEAMAMINRNLDRTPTGTDALAAGMTVWPDNDDTDAWYYLDIQEATNSHTQQQSDDGSETWLAVIPAPDWKQYERR
jgi:hypothetical protein